MHNLFFLSFSAVGSDFENVNPDPFPLTFNFFNQNQAMGLCAPVTIVDDLIFEDDESFYALLSDPNNIPGLVLAPSLARITIIDDDLEIENPTISEFLDCLEVCLIVILRILELKYRDTNLFPTVIMEIFIRYRLRPILPTSCYN